MQNKTGIIILTVIVSIICLYNLSFTFVSRGVQSDAAEYATNAKGEVVSSKKQAYLDSIWTQPVYNFLGIKYTYQDVKERELNLGLDLQGGMNVTLEVSPVEILIGLSGNNDDPAFRQALIKATEARKSSQDTYVNLFVKAYKELKPNGRLADIFANTVTKGRIDYNSSDNDVVKVLNSEVEDAIDRSFEILSRRIDKFGVTQPTIQIIPGRGLISVELPGVDNPERVRKLLQGAAKLEFYRVMEPNEISPNLDAINTYLIAQQKLKKGSATGKQDAASSDNVANLLGAKKDATKVEASQDTVSKDTSSLADQLTAADSTAGGDSLNTQFSPLFSLIKGNGLVYDVKDTAKINKIFKIKEVQNYLPSDAKLAWSVKPINDPTTNSGVGLMELNILKEERDGLAILTGDVINDARWDINPQGKGYEVSMYMNAEGAKKWKKITGANKNKRIAVVLDNYVYTAPVVNDEIPNGVSVITGNFTQDEATDLANILKAGKLPAPTNIVEEAIVGPTLGQESIESGLISIMIGFVIIILFMFFVYSSSGWVADLAVIINLFFLLGVLSNLGAALTLPGIAGILLSLAMAVDANVLINERVKEELASGKTLKDAIASGYKNAFSAIFDSNITTLIAGVVLLIFGTGLIFGFAVTLVIGVVCSLFTSILITRIVFEALLKRNKKVSFSNSLTKNLFRSINVDFIGKRKIYYAISTVVIIGGIVSILIRGFNFGVDFKGGRTFVVDFQTPVSSTEIRKNLADEFGAAPEVKTFGSDDKFKITTDYLVEDDSDVATANVEQKLNAGLAKFSGNETKILSSSKIGPTIANDIKINALYSIIIALVGMFLYILVRFGNWQFALGGIVSLLHDVLVVLAIFSLFQDILPFSLEIDQAFVAAILTIIGYSINDSVVVLDRVREFLANRKASDSFSKIINNALNDTLSRTLITGITTICVLLILFLFGGETIRGFSFAMLIGVLIGTYSSICIGTPILVDFWKESDKLAGAVKPAAKPVSSNV
ncbi:MAG TPA: protein translocase subunit SecDF [Cytophagales bacterium]|nr:protein translocase subunit SecDF [Cytophagales bacterium]